jgi:hypothetical protein
MQMRRQKPLVLMETLVKYWIDVNSQRVIYLHFAGGGCPPKNRAL